MVANNRYCRPWAIAEDPDFSEYGALTPIAPYAVDNSGEVVPETGRRKWGISCTYRASYAKGWSTDFYAQSKIVPPAGCGASDREPHDSSEATKCIQHGGEPMESQYQTACNKKVLAQYHRHNEKARALPHKEREARWYKCFRQLEGQFGQEDAETKITGTNFSILPAGYAPHVGRRPPRGKIIGKYGVEGQPRWGQTRDQAPFASPSKPAAQKDPSDAGGCNASVPGSILAWTQPPAAATTPVPQPLEAEVKPAGERKGFGAWARGAAASAPKARKLKGAEYIKAPVGSWLKKIPAKLRKSDAVATFKDPSENKKKPSDCIPKQNAHK